MARSLWGGGEVLAREILKWSDEVSSSHGPLLEVITLELMVHKLNQVYVVSIDIWSLL